ncbi:hypothetical protein EON63_25210 [archaeon]|nr:MAG: hypothetical protein EON63_25210 [archaeon]
MMSFRKDLNEGAAEEGDVSKPLQYSGGAPASTNHRSASRKGGWQRTTSVQAFQEGSVISMKAESLGDGDEENGQL